MNTTINTLFAAMLAAVAAMPLASCSDDDGGGNHKPTTVTDANYALAETQVRFSGYVARIAEATGTNGTGVFMHERQLPDPADTATVSPYANFDTRTSYAVLDLSKPATLTMPETSGRYQSAWFITEDHYNPMAITTPGTYTITRENMGSRYVMIMIRTYVGMNDSNDIAEVTRLQNNIKLTQADRGEYKASNRWNTSEILAMRNKYRAITREKHINTDQMFGKKGELTPEGHNCGAAYGWGGYTTDQMIYFNYVPTPGTPLMLTLKDVPVAENGFWSVTVYDEKGYPQGEAFNINSSTAYPNDDGSFTVRFGGENDASIVNRQDIFKGWNFVLRLYLPGEACFDGSWTKPELVAQ